MKVLPDIHLGKKKAIIKPDIFEDLSLQLDLGLKESPLNKLFQARQKLERIEDRLKVSQYWKNPLLWITVFFPLSIALIFIQYYVSVQSILPDDVPLAVFHNNISELFLPKIFLLLIPLLIFIFSVVVVAFFRISYRKMEKFIFMMMILYISLSAIAYYAVYNVIQLFV